MGNTGSRRKTEKHNKLEKAPLVQFPVELLIQIFEKLDFRDRRTILSVAKTCKRFNQIVSENTYLWECVYRSFELSINGKPYYAKLLVQLLCVWNEYGICPYKKFITVSKHGRRAERDCVAGSNPAVIGCIPLKQNMSVSIKICSLGSWLSIGLATQNFMFNNSSVVGGQEEDVSNPNFGLYFHPCRIQTGISVRHKHLGINYSENAGNRSVEYKINDVLRMSRKCFGLDIYLNDALIYTFSDFPNKHVLYPCVSLSTGSAVEFV